MYVKTIYVCKVQQGDILLQVNDLNIGFSGAGNMHQVVKNFSIDCRPGEIVGLVGESGSGKTIAMLSLMGLLPANARMEGNSWLHTPAESIHLSRLHEEDYTRVRGRVISMIFQEPMTSLNPVMKVGEQLLEMLLLHRYKNKHEAMEAALKWFEEVKLPNPSEIFHRYPFELSGGQKQRVMIAMAMCCSPALIIADEPSTALDVTVQKIVMDLLKELCNRFGTGLILISHDLALVSGYCTRIIVMRKGVCVEEGSSYQICHQPSHPYTKALLQCRPSAAFRGMRLPVISDFLPEENLPPLPSVSVKSADFSLQPIITVENFSVYYPSGQGKNKSGNSAYTVSDVDFSLRPGGTLAVVGESGSGKTTLIKALVKWLPFHGTYKFLGETVQPGSPPNPLIQMVFQDPYAALNPSLTVGSAISEAAKVNQSGMSSKEAHVRSLELLGWVGLGEHAFYKYPHQFSGGQRQRIVIARALACRPQLLICDESVAALDVSVQSQVLNLLKDLQSALGFAMIFVTHDLHIAEFLSDEILVLRKGIVEEQGETISVFSSPQSAYTKLLLSAIPEIK
jgi:peptide/nickel transport system ATP-binding protein